MTASLGSCCRKKPRNVALRRSVRGRLIFCVGEEANRRESNVPPEALEEKRAVGPLVHCLSNSVTANDCVNPPLASGVAALSR